MTKITFALAAFFSLALTACGPPGESENAGAQQPGTVGNEFTIRIPMNAAALAGDAFGIFPLTISTGIQVTWINDDVMAHTVTSESGEFDSGTLVRGASFSHTFKNAG